MLDADIVAVSPASVWGVLNQAGLLRMWNGKPSKKGTGFEQPPQPHQHWHIDVSYLNVCAAFGGGLRGALQQRAFEQRHRIHHAEGHARRHQQEIQAERDRKLEAARKERQIRRQQAA